MSATVVGLVDGHIPFVIDEIEIAEWRCMIPILPTGGGEDQPLAERTAKCPHRTRFLIGRAPTCPHHIRYAAGLADINLSQSMEVRIGECEAS